MDLMDEIYGDLDDKPFGTLHHNEDSVDIYSGLENSPKVDGHRGRVNSLLSPRTMESMDIYEDIIREEQEEKESTYNELKQKFDEAQKHVKELFSQLQLLQTKNSSLNSENTLLKKNICSLIKTARMEIVRKDEEINRLSNRSVRGSYSQNFRRSQMESGPANTRHSLNNSTSSVLESQGARQDTVMNEVNQHKGKNSASDHCAHPPTTSTTAPQPFEVLQRCPRTDLDSPLQCQIKSGAKSDGKTLAVQPEQDYGPVHHNKTSTTSTDVSNGLKINDSTLRVANTTTDCQFSTLKDNKKSSSKQGDKLEKTQKCTSRDKECNSKDKNVSQKSQKRADSKSSKSGTEKEVINDSSVSMENWNQQPEIPVILKTSEHLKSPSAQSHKSSPSVSSQSFKSSVKTAAVVETQIQRHAHNQNADRTSRETKHSGLSSTSYTVVDEASHSQNHKGKKRDTSGHERKEEKSSSAERKSSRTERSRDHEQKRPKEGNNSSSSSSSRDRRSNRSDSSKEYERRSTRETDNKAEDKRSKKPVDACGQVFSSPKCDSQRKDVYKEKSSSRINEPSSKSKRSHSHDKARKMEDLKCAGNGNSDKNSFGDKSIDKDRERKRGGHLKKHRVHKYRESKNALTKDDRKNSPKKHNVVVKGQDSKNEQDQHLESESPSVVAVSSTPCKTTEDNSPDRKLSFMETLNLTLSPLKKQKQSSDLKDGGATSEDASLHNSNLSDIGEEFFVIDELKNSQDSVEEVDEGPVPTVAGEKEDLTSSCKQSGQVVDLSSAVVSENPSGEQTDMDVQEENVTKSQMAVDKVPDIVKSSEEKKSELSDSNVLEKDLLKLTLTRESLNLACHNTEDSPGIIDNSVVSNTLPTKTSEVAVSDNIPDSIVEVDQTQDPFTILSEDPSPMKIQKSPRTKSQDLPTASNGICQDDVSSSDKAQSIPKINSSKISDSSVNMEVSSSTISADVDEPSKVICDFEQVGTSKQDNKEAGEAIENSKMIETPHSSEDVKMSEKSHQSPLWGENNTAPNDSTTVGEETMTSSQPGFSEPDSTEEEKQNTMSLNPVMICPDEDSMMLTFRNIKVIPEPLSPLTSPVRQVKKVQPQRAEKQPHVKSLNKDLSTVTTGCNKDEVNMDMNKENKSPDSSVTASSYKGTKDALLASGTEEDELEDGEIVSESEEEGPLFIQTPPREKDKSTSGTESSPKLSAVVKRVSQKKSCISAKYSERSKSSKSSSSNDSPTSSKRRFKTVSPPLKAAVYSIDGFMDLLGSIRAELRKKYMKLQKNVTKTAFCCIVDMSQASFIEFINAVDMEKLCCQGNDIKVRLNKIISSIMSKVTKNGIVNRIFEQRAGDLKQKLWTFVDGQFDFLFKELKTALKSESEPSKNASFENKNSSLKRNETESEVVEKELFNTSGHLHKAKMSKVDTGSFVREPPPNNLPRRGLGSRGKNIKAVMNEDDQPAKVATSHQLPTSSSERPVHEGTSGSETRISSYVRRLSHNGSIQDKADFEILTEQQTTSLTFNLVSDSQMGEIFKCLLQGSDLLESSVPIGDNTNWPLSTPRKEGHPGESLIGIMTPIKTTPSKFITSWPSISPYKFATNSKMLVDPAVLDESCLLEVPCSNSEPSQLPLQSTVISQKSYSILAEDLAVSLTIPSPLKSDSHLSFLHPRTGHPLSAPNSVLSAHYSEDALLDGEDATEQDIHLSLDTDNSSSGSSPSRTWEGSEPPGFQFQPNLPMQAVVMERSNDHFIVRIRRTSSGPIESNQNEGKTAPEVAECPKPSLNPNLIVIHEDLASTPGETSNKVPTVVIESCHISDKPSEAQPSSLKSSSEGVCDDSSSRNNAEHVSKEGSVTPHEESSTTETETSDVVSGKVHKAIQSSSSPESESERVSRKRKEHRSVPKAKRQKVEKSQDRHSKSRHKKRSKSSKEKYSQIAVPQVSPSSLSAKNVIRKKGEVVVTWTRDEDRDILVELKMKGTSPKTFAALSKRLKKSTEQIEERFSQLMKLFKKKEKMEN